MKVGTAGTITAVVVAAVGLVAVAAIGLVSPGKTPGAAKPSGACTITNGHFVCQATAPSHAPVTGAKPAPPPSSSGACTITMDSGFWVCAGSAGGAPRVRESGTPTSSPKTDATESSSTTAAAMAASVVMASPPFPYPFEIGPGKPWLAGQPAPTPTPILLMQLSASLATAPASPTATVLLSDWPAAGKGTVTVSVYAGFTSNACASPPLMAKTATASYRGAPATWSATFGDLAVGSYEVQAVFVGKAGPMTTPCGRAGLKVVAAPGSGQ